MMSDEDNREECKYGSACYQKNVEHKKKFKHPKNLLPTKGEELEAKRRKLGNTNLKQQKLNFVFKKNPAPVKNTSLDETPNSSDKETTNVDSNVIVNADVDKWQNLIQKLFLVKMPSDFYEFWNFCTELLPKSPKDALMDVTGLKLVGPFDVLAGILTEEHSEDSSILTHWRYYYDPPEFQTVLKTDRSDLYHIGYFRDAPDELPVFLASNCAAIDPVIKPIAHNIFSALHYYLKELDTKNNGDPFKKAKIGKTRTALEQYTKDRPAITLKPYYNDEMHKRDRKTVAKTFHRAGIVVPYDKKTELGYRPLADSEGNLKKLIKRISESTQAEERLQVLSSLQPTITMANIAADECDFGTGLELGLDFFCSGTPHLHQLAIQLLSTAYSLLDRQPFINVLKAHLQNRKKGDNLSAVETDK